jgi:hypothetical protein
MARGLAEAAYERVIGRSGSLSPVGYSWFEHHQHEDRQDQEQ